MKKQFIFFLLILFCVLTVKAQDTDIDSPEEIRRELTIEKMGDIGQFIPAAVSAALILTHKDGEGGWQYLKGFGVNLTATYVLKYAIDKDRPDGATDGHAFPSGHTSFAFQGASFIQRRYGWEYGIPAYAIAGFVAYSRIEGLNERHDAYDVLGGILVGVGSTYLFTTPYQREHYQLSFSSANQEYMIGLTIKF
ncbi:PAP2 family phosphoesterase [Dokdonia pacifica]|uniref:PAP2 superfamily protein n=1 Tax=Dokdonia pacifica TaxID=1627892 RepID=A0A238VMU2_9FLAO|nr:phosphatase PAP2 family protein [Dokdonia pacifica]GGG20042.1 PAP2 family phosphoesterase [Dokdonia pacifica]SNR35484.1 PAP2 superfamily protein [Dokdonia pacifica]